MDRILAFTQELAGINFYLYQTIFARRIVESILERDGAIITGLWSRQSGKTETVADVCTGLCVILPALAKTFPDDPRFMSFRDGFLIGVYAPIADQAEFPFSRMKMNVQCERGTSILADPEIGIMVTQSRGDRLAFSNGSRVICKSASPDTNIEGATHHLVLVEEAQKVSRSKVEKDIRPMLAATNGTMVKIGTAWVSRGGFHTSIQHNIEVYEQGGKRNHFEFPYDVVIAEKQRAYDREVKENGIGNPFHLNYEKFVNSEVDRLGGTDSEEFKMNFRCLWLESRLIAINETIFGQAALDMEAMPTPHGFQVGGLDIGKTNDSSVLTIMTIDFENPVVNTDALPGADEEKQVYHRKIIIDWMEMAGSFEGNSGQYATLANYLRGTNLQVLLIDATSIGDPVYERIEAMLGGSIQCLPFKFNAPNKSKLYRYYLQELHARRVYYAAGELTQKRPEFKRFVQQHLDLDKGVSGGYILCQAPEGGYDDYPDSAALACWAEKHAESVAMPEIIVTNQVSSHEGGRVSAATRGRAGRYARRW